VYDQLLKTLHNEQITRSALPRGVVHSFCGSLYHAQELIKMNYLIGINGMVCQDPELAKVVSQLKLRHLVLETDAPYFHPIKEDLGRNEPKNVQIVGQFVAKLQNKSIYEVNQVTTQNALHLFNIMRS
jgi:TatD DNase family protein